MYRIRCYNNISAKGLAKLPDSITASASQSPADGLLLRSYQLSGQEIEERVCAVVRAGTGTNNIPIAECSQRGIVVFNTPGANANSVKELVICAMLLASRKLHQSLQWVAELPTAKAEAVESGKKIFAGPEIAGKTLGLIGLGTIGSLVANAAKDLGMAVIGYDPFLSVQNALRLPKGIQLFGQLDEVLRRGDYISLHLPLSAETQGLIGKQNLATLKAGARLINFARAELVDDAAAAQALQEQKISYYVSDFPSAAFRGLEQAICFPHLGASTPEAEDNCAVMACERMADFLRHGNICHSVNYPWCKLERESEYRLTFAHKNIPNMLGQISSTVAKHSLNIQEMSNRHQGDYAYTIVDVDAAPDNGTLHELAAIPGILRLRYLVA